MTATISQSTLILLRKRRSAKLLKRPSEKFKKIDVVVNNAGCGIFGEFEDLSDEQIRRQMEVNFFELIDVTRKALEVMRSPKSGGIIQQITSVGGQRDNIQKSTRHACLQAYLRTIRRSNVFHLLRIKVGGGMIHRDSSHELKPEWNIHLTCVGPGGFRTDWAGRSMVFGKDIPHMYVSSVRDGLRF